MIGRQLLNHSFQLAKLEDEGKKSQNSNFLFEVMGENDKIKLIDQHENSNKNLKCKTRSDEIAEELQKNELLNLN